MEDKITYEDRLRDDIARDILKLAFSGDVPLHLSQDIINNAARGCYAVADAMMTARIIRRV